jgi:plasmid stability protein
MVPKWIQNGSMISVTLSVKNVPRDVARRLKARAVRNHRSLQGELLAILTDASQVVSITDLAALARRLRLAMPSESAQMIRDDRDGRRR